MRRAIVSYCLVTTSLVAIGHAAAQDTSAAPAGEETIVVTGASREAIRLNQSGSAISVLTADILEARQTRIVADILRDLPGVSVNVSGPAGGLTQLRLRGAESNHTLVVIDGIEVNEPFNGEFDFAGLFADDIERIELIRGQQSALYGSDAIGGVVNIVTRGGSGPLNGSARLEGGSFGTFAGMARFGYANERFDIAGSYGYYDTDGTPTARNGVEDDGYRNQTLRLKAGVEVTDNLSLSFAGRFVDSKAETDPQDFDFPPTPTAGLVIDRDETYEEQAFYWRAAADLDLFDDQWRQQLQVQGANVERETYSLGLESFLPKGTRFKLGYQSSVFFGADREHRITAAFDHERETYQNRAIGAPVPSINDKRKLTTNGYVLEYGGEFGALDIGAAIRRDDNDRFEDATTWKVSASYRVDDWGTRFRARYGTGVKNPTNFELYGYDEGTFLGNPDLKPEKSEGWEIGFDQEIADGRALLAVTYFDSVLEDEINTLFLPSFESTPVNLATDSKQQGVEIELSAELAEGLTLAASYTYTDAKQNGVAEVRRPRHVGSVNLSYAFAGDRGLVNLNVRYNGEMTDNEFVTYGIATLDSFTLVNLAASYKVTEGVEIFARGENLLDEDYEEVFSYVAPGAAGYAGVKVSF